MTRQYDEFSHVPDGLLGEVGKEVYAFIEKRVRELDPTGAGKPLCNGCVGTLLHNAFISASLANTWTNEEFAEAAYDLGDRLERDVAITTDPIGAAIAAIFLQRAA